MIAQVGGLRERVTITGGVARNIGVVRALEEELETSIIVTKEPQIVGALGAALIAAEQSVLRERIPVTG
jgi:activator of 2-hydroxyglutaryl-CoA dehydratase